MHLLKDITARAPADPKASLCNGLVSWRQCSEPSMPKTKIKNYLRRMKTWLDAVGDMVLGLGKKGMLRLHPQLSNCAALQAECRKAVLV